MMSVEGKYELKELRLWFENQEGVVIDSDHVGHLELTGFNEIIRHTADKTGFKVTLISERIDNVSIMILDPEESVKYAESYGEKISAYKRLRKFNDIVGIDLYLEDENGNTKTEEYGVNYADAYDHDGVVDSDCANNRYQTTWESKAGSCYIIISAKPEMHDLISTFGPSVNTR